MNSDVLQKDGPFTNKTGSTHPASTFDVIVGYLPFWTTKTSLINNEGLKPYNKYGAITPTNDRVRVLMVFFFQGE